MSPLISEQLARITKTIVDQFQPEKVVLFGSQAEGTATSGSDIDLFVVKKTSKRPHERELELRKMLFGHRFPAMDLLVYTPEEVAERERRHDFFIEDIFAHGKVLYAK